MSSDSSYEVEIGAAHRGAPAGRAGLRIARPVQTPPTAFAVVEMAVLVLVTALAMVSVIVSSTADASPPAASRADASKSVRAAGHAADAARRDTARASGR